jgi:hypothetical protein
MEKMEVKAIDIIVDVLDEKREVDDTAKMAMKTLGVVAKNRQTLTNRQAIGFSMAQSIANESQLKKYISVTNPKVQKALAGKAV